MPTPLLLAELETVLADAIKRFPGAIRTHTVLALSSRKESAAVPCGAAPA